MISPVTLPPKVAPGEPIRAGAWNALVDAVRSISPTLRIADPAGPVAHPWKVTATQTDEETVRLDVRCGCVNDTAATIAWKVKNDPRGNMPEAAKDAHAEALNATPESAFLREYYDRPLHEAEPPFLTLPIEPTNAAWTESTRPPKALKDSASAEAKFHVAGVVLAAFPFNIVATVPFPKRFRVYAGRANPAALNQARSGELLQLAQVWQVREGGELSTISVSQKVFWNVACMAVEPSLQLPGTVETDPISAALMGQGNSYLDTLESTLSTTQFWTV